MHTHMKAQTGSGKIESSVSYYIDYFPYRLLSLLSSHFRLFMERGMLSYAQDRNCRSAVPMTIWFTLYSGIFGEKLGVGSREERKGRSKNFNSGVFGCKQHEHTFTKLHKKERIRRILLRRGSLQKSALWAGPWEP